MRSRNSGNNDDGKPTKLDEVRQAVAKFKPGHPEADPGHAEPPASVPAQIARPAHAGFRLVSNPSEPPRSGIVGKILKFAKGEFSVERGARIIPIGTKMVARDVIEKWVKFKDQSIVAEFTRNYDLHFPKREELGDLDQEKWPLDKDGKPQDPWSLNFYLLLFCIATMQDYTFISNTFGGADAVRQLSKQISYRYELTGQYALAQIRLETTKRNSKKWGAILGPHFPVDDWLGEDLRPIKDLSTAELIDDNVDY